ncbi:hypothetical protein NHH03_22265 [Stieleria sp. TO1_6]|uniref:hypothetical protein n=1 Tax=Stieleria tagensis TaxID=2956795 RepID=UPI00209B9509|nr:hypothetical protein [Stieleria tagensis]MCO8124481.1 hypothetical protein [Stieleria tagensis]
MPSSKMPPSIVRYKNPIIVLALLTVGILCAGRSDAASNQPPDGIRFDGLVSESELQNMTGQPLAIKLRSGRFIVKVTVDELQFDRKQNGLKFLKYLSETGRTSTVKVSDLYAFWVKNQRYQLRYFPPTQQLFVINAAAADATAESRLAAEGNTIRESLDDKEQVEATTEHRQFLEEAANKLKDVASFRIEETESTLIFTDYPPAATTGLRRFVDTMNEQLNHLFGIPMGDSVWRGKAILAVFSSPALFGQFEERVMNNPNHGGRAGVRSGPKRFLQTAIAKKLDQNVARGLCWGYSLGFANRLHSTARGVPWINMGIANTIQFAIVPDQRRQKSQRADVIRQIKNAGSLLGLLDATKLEQERWPLSGQLVNFLVTSDSIAFSQLFRDVKLGVPLEEALEQNFGASKAELADRFGRSLGVAGVQP